MGEKIVVGPQNRGLRNDVIPFNIDNDSFSAFINAYQWRGRAKRKRGTAKLGRLTRYFDSTSASYNSGSTTITLDASGIGNILTDFGLEANGNIVPGSVEITAPGPTLYTDALEDGTLSPSGSINYASGQITILAEAGNAVSAIFKYYPNLPVMGLEDLLLTPTQYPLTLAFDTVYSYEIGPQDPFPIRNVSFYKNPPVDATNLPGYVPKTNVTPLTWNGQDYQQFWSVNYQKALWATNGINVPFSTSNIGMQFKSITGVAIVTAGNGTTIPAVADITIVAHGLVQGDFLFINQVDGITGINFQTGYVTSADPQNPNVIRVTFPFSVLGGAYVAGGIAQYLTNTATPGIHCLRWYDGDPTNGNADNPVLNGNKGWVNFCPPLSESNFSIADLPAAQYYLIGARMIVPFKDRLVFFGPVVERVTAAGASFKFYLQDTAIYSQNGTPYYTASYTNTPSAAVDTPTSATNVFRPILLPDDQTSNSPAYFEDQTGFGGFVSAGIAQPILTVSSNEDVLIVGFTEAQTRFIYTGNDIIPFNFFVINSEFGSASTFSAINMDQGVITRGSRGYVITSQTRTDRIDMEIPDEVFQIRLTNNGSERVCAQRDYINEWIYFTYPVNSFPNPSPNFPTQTLLYNYRDDSWGIFRETYTTYGSFRRQTGLTWNTVGNTFPTWIEWNVPWNAGSTTLFQPEVIGGNQQGYIMFRDEGTAEGKSLFIKNISGNTVTSPNHCLRNGDFIVISGCLGTVGQEVNNRTFRVNGPLTLNTFTLDPIITGGTYLGNGEIKKIYVPFIQSKQFPVAWGIARKARLGSQQYLLTTTQRGQIQLLIYLSQNNSSPYNAGNIVPAVDSSNDSLIYSTVLYTCPESTNLGLTPSNINLQMVTAINQEQIWHRLNTSLIGDTVQVGFTISKEQITELTPSVDTVEITGATQATQCVLTCENNFQSNQLILIEDVEGMTQLNGNIYNVISSTGTNVTLEVDSTGFDAYTTGGTATPVANFNQEAEIELHGFILDVNPSQVLA